MKFLHAADLHIDSPLRGLQRREGAPIEAIRRAPRGAFSALIGLALEQRVDFIILAGDIYDGDWRDVGTGLFFASELRRLGEIPVFIARGNHDAQSRITKVLSLPSNVREFTTREPQTHHLTIGDVEVAVHGQSYANRSVTDDLAAGYPDKHDGCVNIGVLHTSLSGYAAHETYAPTTPAMLRAKGYDYWALGHIHERQIVADDPLIVYPGNIQGRHIHEAGPKGCVIVSDDGSRGALRTTFHPLDTVRWAHVEVDIHGASDLDAVLGAAREQLTRAVGEAEGRTLCARMTLRGGVACHAELLERRDEVEAQIRADTDAFAWLESLRIATTPPRDPATLREAEGLLGDLFRSIDHARTDQTSHTELAAALSAVRERVPADVRRMFGTPLTADAADFASLLDDAERILAAKVLA